MTDTASNMLIKSALAEIEQLKARLRETEAERDDTGFRLKEHCIALELAQEALFWHNGENFEDKQGRRVGDVIKQVLLGQIGEPTPEELVVAEAESAKAETEYQGPSRSDYWYDHANGRYQRY